ncbi:MAG TPA: C4-type zinc ribbon domain-containing protein [Candidatus Limiplasma sp.]|nr:C4-type zinc ribbon domain-containing protein [Candidatus Limiplasma sp.]HPS81305.1 C4-type zinc ribbon domain-containing protein [Candidatus Limiplasma sp.]
MEQIEMLWEFQQADMEADALEGEIKRSPNRLALKKNRDFLMEQQTLVKQMEEEVAEMLDRVDIIKDAITLQQEQLKGMQVRFTETPPENLEQARAFTHDAQKLASDIQDYEQEMKRIQQDATEHERVQKEIVVKYAKVKTEYEKQKVDYEEEYREQMKALEQKRHIAQEKGKDIEPALMEKYQVIKKHCTPPVAKLVNGQCGGCFMGLPQVTLRNLKAGAKVIECESCGRMIIQL